MFVFILLCIDLEIIRCKLYLQSLPGKTEKKKKLQVVKHQIANRTSKVGIIRYRRRVNISEVERDSTGSQKQLERDRDRQDEKEVHSH